MRKSFLFFSLLSAVAQTPQPRSRISVLGSFSFTLPTFVSRTDGWAVDPRVGLMRTADGGTTWIKVDIRSGSNATQTFFGYYPSVADAWVLARPFPIPLRNTGQYLFHSSDGGRNWVEQPLPEAGWTGDSLASDPKSGSVWLGGQVVVRAKPPDTLECPQPEPGMFWKSIIWYQHGRSDWAKQSLPRETGCSLNFVRFIGSQQGVAVSQKSFFYTEDGGVTWLASSVETSEAVDSWHKAEVSEPAALTLLEGNSQIAWVSYPEGAVLRTVDGGRHWKQIVRIGGIWSRSYGVGQWGAIYFATESIGWALGGNGEVYETRNGGLGWSKLAVPERVIGLSGAQGLCWLAGVSKLYRIDEH